jgi:L-ascorbate metabolism protein UlaG (beta-lactamase superfamily)
MKIKFLGHAAVELVAASGLKILFDPYTPGHHFPPGGTLFHAPISEPYDIVAVTHEHPDHNAVTAVPGSPAIVRGMQIRGQGIVNVRGIDFWSIGTYHDDKGGILGGENSILCCNVDGVRVGHSGDIGHVPTKEQLEEIKKYGGIDVFLLCVGLIEREGERYQKFIIDTEATTMNGIWEAMKPIIHWLIPIHYRNAKCDFRFITVDEFCKGKEGVKREEVSGVEYRKASRPVRPEIIVLKPAL